MINTNMRYYDYFTYGAADEYGQQTLIKNEAGEPIVQGTVKLSITTSSQEIQGNINYKECSYVGLTLDKTINDTFVIKYGEQLLKVLYVNPQGRFRQVFFKSL